MKIVIHDIFLKWIQSIQKLYLIVINIYHFYPKEKKLKKLKNLSAVQKTKKYVIHIRALKQALNHGLKLKDVHRVIQFKQKAWLKPYIDMNTEFKKSTKQILEKFL